MTFDLENAISHWRRGLSQRGSFSAEDLEELEAHIRDHTASNLAAGMTERDAFTAAIRRFGDPYAVAQEYRKVAWAKTRRERGLLRAAAGETSMIGSYVKVGFRNLIRDRIYAGINVFGLAVGLACCLLITLHVRFELSYDRHHEKAERIYRVTREWIDENGDNVLALARISVPIGPAMARELPEVESAVRLVEVEAPVTAGEHRFVEPGIFIADSGYFDVFSTSAERGDVETALAAANTVVLTTPVAKKYFGTEDPLGRTLRLFDEIDLTVTAVVAPQPSSSHFHPDFLVSFGTTQAWMSPSDYEEWGQYNNFATYVLLAPGSDATALESKLPTFLRAHYTPDNNTNDVLRLQPLTSIHLNSHLDAEFEPNGNKYYVILFVVVALLVLVIACFNFINLATARAAQRSKEVGMRKVLGAYRGQLVRQFLGESAVLTLLALVGAAVIVWTVLPAFAELSGRPLSGSRFGIGEIVIYGISGILAVSLLAGAYPAIYLSRFQPSDVLRQTGGGSWRSRLRSILVVSQFAISIVLIVGMGSVLRQVAYIQNKDLGFEKERLVVLPIAPEMRTDFERYRRQLVASPFIEEVTASKLVPSNALVDHVGVRAQVDGSMKHASLALNPVDHGFVETYRMRLKAGRAFSKDLASDSTKAVVINQAAVDLLGWASAEDAVGQPFVFEASSFTRSGTVIGVVEDFHFESLRNRIAPLVLFIMPDRYQRVTVRVAPGMLDDALTFLEERWADYRPTFPFRYSFVDEKFGALYEADRKVGQLFSYFAFLAVMIASLGLLGLASFVTEKRRKEIGVRKVLGATVGTIVRMLSLDFLRLVGVAFIVACPVAFLIVRWWLERFAYRTDQALWLFGVAGIAVAALALGTVAFQSVRSALADPVLSLREN